MAAPSLDWCPSQVLGMHNCTTPTQHSPGRPSVLLGRKDSTLTPGLREQQGPHWDRTPRVSFLSQNVVIGPGPKGQGDHRVPVAIHSQPKPPPIGLKLMWGPLPL